MKIALRFRTCTFSVTSNCLADILVCDKDNGAVLRFDDGGNYLGYFVPPGTGILDKSQQPSNLDRMETFTFPMDHQTMLFSDTRIQRERILEILFSVAILFDHF